MRRGSTVVKKDCFDPGLKNNSRSTTILWRKEAHEAPFLDTCENLERIIQLLQQGVASRNSRELVPGSSRPMRAAIHVAPRLVPPLADVATSCWKTSA